MRRAWRRRTANKPRPAAPVNLTVYVNDARVSISPNSVGGGDSVDVPGWDFLAQAAHPATAGGFSGLSTISS